MRSTIALVIAIAVTALTAGAAIAGDPPDQRNHYKLAPFSNLWLETSACPGFSTATPLLFPGTSMGMYRQWYDPEPYGEEAGWTQIKATATDGAHSFAIHQRYVYPREFREYAAGFATTVVLRDDGATMTGWSWLGGDPLIAPAGVWWIGAPTCTPGDS